MSHQAIVRRWRAKLAARLALLGAARRRYQWHPTPANRAVLNQRKRQVAEARRVIARHTLPHGVDRQGLDFIKGFEGFVDHQYDDGSGVTTIGYGTTKADVDPLPKHLTEPEAARLLQRQLNTKYAPVVLRALAPLHPNQHMVNAATSFAYNLGVGAFQAAPGFETLTRALRRRDRESIAEAFLLYDNPYDPRVHEGLSRRRRAEHDLFLRED